MNHYFCTFRTIGRCYLEKIHILKMALGMYHQLFILKFLEIKVLFLCKSTLQSSKWLSKAIFDSTLSIIQNGLVFLGIRHCALGTATLHDF